MTKRVFYERVGKRYVPVSEYDSDLQSSLNEGDFLVMSRPGGRSFRRIVDPEYAPMIAAGRICEDVISNAIIKAHEMRPHKNQVLTPEQLNAWNNLISVLGDRARYLEWPSAREITQAAIEAMSQEAIKLLTNESVRKAYDHFQVVAILAR